MRFIVDRYAGRRLAPRWRTRCSRHQEPRAGRLEHHPGDQVPSRLGTVTAGFPPLFVPYDDTLPPHPSRGAVGSDRAFPTPGRPGPADQCPQVQQGLVPLDIGSLGSGQLMQGEPEPLTPSTKTLNASPGAWEPRPTPCGLFSVCWCPSVRWAG